MAKAKRMARFTESAGQIRVDLMNCSLYRMRTESAPEDQLTRCFSGFFRLAGWRRILGELFCDEVMEATVICGSKYNLQVRNHITFAVLLTMFNRRCE